MNALARAGLGAPTRRTTDSLIAPVFDAEGPLWYRGYFGKGRTAAPAVAEIEEALARYGASTIARAFLRRPEHER